jgi:hypothetical protein
MKRKMTRKEEFIHLSNRYWYSMFPLDGYISDGIYIKDMNFEEEYESADEEELVEVMNEYRKLARKGKI